METGLFDDHGGLYKMLKGPLKYLVAKLHGCYPGANSLPVSQNFFRALFSAPVRRRFKWLFNFFTSLQQTQKTLFATIFFINVLLYGYNM